MPGSARLDESPDLGILKDIGELEIVLGNLESPLVAQPAYRVRYDDNQKNILLNGLNVKLACASRLSLEKIVLIERKSKQYIVITH